MNAIRLAVNKTGLMTVFRNSVGFDAQHRVRYGLAVGSSDLIGFRHSDGKFVAIEVKTMTGRESKEQEMFRNFVNSNGGIAIVARSVEDALTQLFMQA